MGNRWRRLGEKDEPTGIGQMLDELRQIEEEIQQTESQVMSICPAMEPLWVDAGGALAVGDILPRNVEIACHVHVVLVCLTGRAILSVEGQFQAMQPVGYPGEDAAPSHRYIPAGTPWRAVNIKGRTVALVVHTG